MDIAPPKMNPSVYVRLAPTTQELGIEVMRRIGYVRYSKDDLPVHGLKKLRQVPTFRVNRDKSKRVFDALRAVGVVFWYA